MNSILIFRLKSSVASAVGLRMCFIYEWIVNVKGKDALCLAGAGGLQAPLLAAAGANVTVIDISEKMLDRDRQMAKKYNLDIRIEHGNMTDLSRFSDGSFDYVINPASLFYVPDVMPVFRECYRVLRHGGSLILAAPSPIAYVCDFVNDENGGYYKAVNKMPYISAEHPDQGDWVEFGHSMQDYLGGQSLLRIRSIARSNISLCAFPLYNINIISLS